MDAEKGWAVALPNAPFEYAAMERLSCNKFGGVGIPIDRVMRHRYATLRLLPQLPHALNRAAILITHNFEESIMRSTKATAAVERLKRRSGNAQYSMVRTASGLFYLVLNSGATPSEQLSDPLELDAFVKFVNEFGRRFPEESPRWMPHSKSS